MIVSWEWLRQYVALDVGPEELCRRLTMAGLNHEGTEPVGSDLAIELEVTSNRPDCLGHLGIAREAAAVCGARFSPPEVTLKASGPPVETLTSVQVKCPELCPRYLARVIRGVRVGPSPDWLRRRLATCGIGLINNVVDITNYVMLEASQPLHAFDYDKLHEHRIVVRRAKKGEQIVAINGRTYELDESMCVIADALRPVAIAGVMGGLETEISERTTTVLIESAQFDPVSVRRTSRRLGLSSPSSFRFERGVDPRGVDWASRRCCQLILELAGGELAQGATGLDPELPPRPKIILRFDQLERILGISIPPQRVLEILEALELAPEPHGKRAVAVAPPSWRQDLEREIDLVEEVGRIHGYEQVPEDVPIPAVCPPSDPAQQCIRRLRQILVAHGLHEAYTLTFVEPKVLELIRPWSEAVPLRVQHPSRRQENCLRQSLLPSLLLARRLNESRGNEDVALFEIARSYWPRDETLPEEPLLLGIVSSPDLERLKGVFEALFDGLHVRKAPAYRPGAIRGLAEGLSADVLLDEQRVGVLGITSPAVVEALDLRKPCAVGELRIDLLVQYAKPTVRFEPFSPYPAIHRDFSFVVDETVSWASVEALVREHAGEALERIEFKEIYRGKPIPQGKKSVHFRVVFRSTQRTLTSEEVDCVQQAIIEAVSTQLNAELRR